MKTFIVFWYSDSSSGFAVVPAKNHDTADKKAEQYLLFQADQEGVVIDSVYVIDPSEISVFYDQE